MAEVNTSQWVAQVEAEALARLEAAAALQESLTAARGRGTSADRSVTVSVGASGVLTDITFSDRAPAQSPDRLRSSVLDAAARAQADVAAHVAALMEGLPGASAMTDLVAGRVPSETTAALEYELHQRRTHDGPR